MCFNPRSNTGEVGQANLVSIHALTRGATRNLSSILDNAPVSIHAPTRGATPDFVVVDGPFEGFNPRSRAGSDTLRL